MERFSHPHLDKEPETEKPKTKKKRKRERAALEEKEEKTEPDKPACIFGDKCYRTSKVHLAEYMHPPKSTSSDAYSFGVDSDDERHVSDDDVDEADEDTVTVPRREWEELQRTVAKLTKALLERTEMDKRGSSSSSTSSTSTSSTSHSGLTIATPALPSSSSSISASVPVFSPSCALSSSSEMDTTDGDRVLKKAKLE